MIDSELINLDSLDFSDNQTWLWRHPEDSGEKVDIVDWYLSCDWPNQDQEYLQMEKDLNTMLDNIIKRDLFLSIPDKHKFDSRTNVKPKRRPQRPSIQSIVEVSSNPSSTSPSPSLHPSLNPQVNPLDAISPMLRLKTFNVDTNTGNSTPVKEYAMKRRSLIQDDDPQLTQEMDVSEASGRLSMEHTPSKPNDIELSQSVHNIHNTFNKGLTNILKERGSLDMYQSVESLMKVSPPSLLLVSSLMMESSGNFNPDELEEFKPSGYRKELEEVTMILSDTEAEEIQTNQLQGLPVRSGLDNIDNFTDGNKMTLQQEDCESTLISSSPPDSVVPDTTPAPAPQHYPHGRVSSTPLMSLRKGAAMNDLNLSATISPIYEMVDDEIYSVTKVQSSMERVAPIYEMVDDKTYSLPKVQSSMERTYVIHNTTVSVERDILAGKASPEKGLPPTEMRSPSPSCTRSRVPPTVSYASMAPPTQMPRIDKTSLPTSKLRQYSSHGELSRIPGGSAGIVSRGRGIPPCRSMLRLRRRYASNPTLSPTAPTAPTAPDHYTIAPQLLPLKEDKPVRTVITNPPSAPAPLVRRQGTETLRRETLRAQSQLVAPRDPPTSRLYSVAGASQLRVNRPTSGAVHRPVQVGVVEQPRPASSNEPRLSGLPRPSRLPAPAPTSAPAPRPRRPT